MQRRWHYCDGEMNGVPRASGWQHHYRGGLDKRYGVGPVG